jgi:transposase
MLIQRRLRGKNQIKKLKVMLKACEQYNNLRTWRRIKGILLYIRGEEVGAIAAMLEVGLQTVYDWIHRYRELGPEGLYEGNHTGRPPLLSKDQLMQLADIIESGPVAYGLISGIWTSRSIREVIKQKFGVRYHDAHVRKLLYRLGFSVQDPRKQLARADEQLQQRWIRHTYPSIKKNQAARRADSVSR